MSETTSPSIESLEGMQFRSAEQPQSERPAPKPGVSEFEEAQQETRLENLSSNQDLSEFFKAVHTNEELKAENPELDLDASIQKAAEEYVVKHFGDENIRPDQLLVDSSMLIRLANARRTVERLFFDDMRDDPDVQAVADAVAVSITDRLETSIKIDPNAPLEDQLRSIEQVSDEEIGQILGNFRFELVDDDLGENLVDFQENNSTIRISRPALQRSTPEERADIFKLAKNFRELMGFDLQESDDEGWVENVDVDILNPNNPEQADESKAFILEQAQKLGIEKIDLVYYLKFKNKKNAFVLARSLVELRQKRERGEADDEEITRLRRIGNELVNSSLGEKSSDILVPKNFFDNRTFQPLLERFIKVWNAISSRPDLFSEENLSALDLEEVDFSEDMGGNDTSSSEAEEQVDKGGESKEKPKAGLGAKGARASGKSTGPKNLKEALWAMFKACDSDILSQLNLPGAIVDDFAKGMTA